MRKSNPDYAYFYLNRTAIFIGSEADTRKYNDLLDVKRGNSTTSGNLTRQAARNARSRHETRSNMLDTYGIAESKLRAHRRRQK